MPNLFQWKEFMSFGAQVPDEALEHRICQLAPNKCCTLIYTVLSFVICTTNPMSSSIIAMLHEACYHLVMQEVKEGL